MISKDMMHSLFQELNMIEKYTAAESFKLDVVG